MHWHPSTRVGEERLLFAAREAIASGGAGAQDRERSPQQAAREDSARPDAERPAPALIRQREAKRTTRKREFLSREIEQTLGTASITDEEVPAPTDARESEEPQPIGSVTDAAMILIRQAGLLAPGQGLGRLERELGIQGQFNNYTALSDRLFVEAIDAAGVARKFAVTLTARQSTAPSGHSFELVDHGWRSRLLARLRAGRHVLRTFFEKRRAPKPDLVATGQLISTYQTVTIGDACSGSIENQSIAGIRVKRNGPLPALLKRALTSHVRLERIRNDIESPIALKKDGVTIGTCTESINDRDRWESSLADLLAAALGDNG